MAERVGAARKVGISVAINVGVRVEAPVGVLDGVEVVCSDPRRVWHARETAKKVSTTEMMRIREGIWTAYSQP